MSQNRESCGLDLEFSEDFFYIGAYVNLNYLLRLRVYVVPLSF
jgi:hypothetical protein